MMEMEINLNKSPKYRAFCFGKSPGMGGLFLGALLRLKWQE